MSYTTKQDEIKVDAMIAAEDAAWSKMDDAKYLLDIFGAWGAPKKALWHLDDFSPKSGLTKTEIKKGDAYCEISIKKPGESAARVRVLWTEMLEYRRNLRKGIVLFGCGR